MTTAKFTVHKHRRSHWFFPRTAGLGPTARMAAGATRLLAAGGGWGAGLGAGDAAGTVLAGAGLAGPEAGGAAALGSKTVLPHWPQLLAPPPA